MIAATYELAIEIGAMPIVVRTQSAEFMRLLEDRYGSFVNPDTTHPVFELEIELVEPGHGIPDTDRGKDSKGDEDDKELSVRLESGRWVMERGDFRAELNPETRRGWVRQTANPYSIDGVLRILHSLLLAREGGFLVHAASAVRNGRAYLFAGVSGAGKTTISCLAPPDVKLLTDEISYVRRSEEVSGVRCQVSVVGGEELEARSQESGVRSQELEVRSQEKSKLENRKSPIANHQSQITNRQLQIAHPESRGPSPEARVPAFEAFGTPFAGELARVGENLRAPLAALYLLVQGPENRVEPVSDAEATRGLLRNILFFAQDPELAGRVFQTTLDFVRHVPVKRLIFAPDARVWEMIG